MHHEKDTAGFALEAKEGQDPDLKAFAAKQLPILKEHLQQLSDLATHQTAAGTHGETAGRLRTG
jgi:putative membrane protein